MDLMPELKQDLKVTKEDSRQIDAHAASSIFSIWRNGIKNNNGRFRRPSTLSMFDVDDIQKEGLAKIIGDEIEITRKGNDIIKIMILGDDRSVYEDNGHVVDYNEALSNAKNVKIAKQQKVASSWWDRFNK